MRIVYILFFLMVLSACQSDPPVGETSSVAASPSTSPAADYETNPYQWGFIDRSGKLVIADRFDEVRGFSEGLALVRKNGKWGYINTGGAFQISASLRAAWPFQGGVAKAQADDGKYGLINPVGEWVSEAQWDELRPFTDSWASVRLGAKYGMIDTQGKIRVPLEYDGPGQRNGANIIIRKNSRYGMIDTTGRELIPFDYERLKPFADGLARAKTSGRYGYLTTTGKWQIEPQYLQAGDFAQGLAPVLMEERWGLIDQTGKLVVEPQFAQLFYAHSNRWIAEIAGEYYLLDNTGSRLAAGPFTELHPFHEDLATFRDEQERWGYINPAGEVVIEASYLLSWPFRDGQARVATPDGITLINRSGRALLTPNAYFIEVQEFSEGLAPVQVYK